MNDNLLHLTVTDCMECGCKIKGDAGRTICNECMCKALVEARILKEPVLAEVVDLTKFRISSQEGKDGEALKRDGALRGVRGLP